MVLLLCFQLISSQKNKGWQSAARHYDVPTRCQMYNFASRALTVGTRCGSTPPTLPYPPHPYYAVLAGADTLRYVLDRMAASAHLEIALAQLEKIAVVASASSHSQ